jgi:hypothetical protein
MPESRFPERTIPPEAAICDACLESFPQGLRRCELCGQWFDPLCMADHRMERTVAHIASATPDGIRRRSLCRFVEHLGSAISSASANAWDPADMAAVRTQQRAIEEWHAAQARDRRAHQAAAEGIPLPSDDEASSDE